MYAQRGALLSLLFAIVAAFGLFRQDIFQHGTYSALDEIGLSAAM